MSITFGGIKKVKPFLVILFRSHFKSIFNQGKNLQTKIKHLHGEVINLTTKTLCSRIISQRHHKSIWSLENTKDFTNRLKKFVSH